MLSFVVWLGVGVRCWFGCMFPMFLLPQVGNVCLHAGSSRPVQLKVNHQRLRAPAPWKSITATYKQHILCRQS